MKTAFNDRPWNEWSDAPPPQNAAGHIEGEFVLDGNVTATDRLYCYCYADERGMLWGYSTGSFRDDNFKTHHPKFHRWRYTGPRVPTQEAQGKAIFVWRFWDAPGELRALSPHGGDEDWLALCPDGDIPSWMECDTSFAACDASTCELPDGRWVVIGAHA
jgi:hypothetical protein